MTLRTCLDPVADEPGYAYNLAERRILLDLIQKLIDRLTLLTHKLADSRYEDPLSAPEWQYLIDTACRLLYHKTRNWVH